MNAMPTNVRVGPFDYSILMDAEEIARVSDEADTGSNGAWEAFSDHDALIIGINPKHSLGAQRRDVLHELLHCCLRVAGVWPNHYADLVAEARGKDDGLTVEEFCVAGATAPLLGVLRDNPALLKWLTQG